MKLSIPIEKIAKFLPAVEKATYKQTFNKKLIWTGIALLLYLLLTHISVFGIGQTPELEALRTFQTLLGAKFGSMMTLGIGPIVTAGILLQLLTGSKIIDWDMSDPENRKKFQSWNKFLAIALCFIEGIAFIMAGAIPVATHNANGKFVGANVADSVPLASSTVLALTIFLVIQLAAGGIIVILLDELVSKWGFGSGISLFIIAGVTTSILVSAFSPFQDIVREPGMPVGLVWKFFINIMGGDSFRAVIAILPLIFTAIVFVIVVYAQGIKIPIPITFSSLRGFSRSWDLKLFYTSNIPVILAAALLANVQLMAHIGLDPVTKCGLLGCYNQQNAPASGLIYYLSAPSLIKTISSGIPFDFLQLGTYLLFFTVVCTLFGIFWVSTSGMDAGSVAGQLLDSGLQIPGYRADKKTIEGVLKKYIPALALLGGLAVGLLAAFADITDALGTGTGILLTVMIIYQIYEQLGAEPKEDAHPIVKKILGEE
jgi:preprotein translocase subunit SecY